MARPREFNKDDVIEKAMFLFWEQGYETTSVRDLTKATGISSSSMYEAFGDKRGVFLVALARFCELEKASIEQTAQEASSPHTFIEHLFDSLQSLSLPHSAVKGSMSFNTMVEFGIQDAAVTDLLLTHYFSIGDIITTVLQKGQVNGTVTQRVDASDLALTILSTLQGVATLRGVKPDVAYGRNIVRVVLHFITP